MKIGQYHQSYRGASKSAENRLKIEIIISSRNVYLDTSREMKRSWQCENARKKWRKISSIFAHLIEAHFHYEINRNVEIMKKRCLKSNVEATSPQMFRRKNEGENNQSAEEEKRRRKSKRNNRRKSFPLQYPQKNRRKAWRAISLRKMKWRNALGEKYLKIFISPHISAKHTSIEKSERNMK